MNESTRQTIFENAKHWVLEAGDRIRERMKSEFQIDTKSNPNDLVTEVDKATEQFFASKIRSEYKDHFIIGEEGYGDKVESLDGTVWIIDPIDGTMNFVHQKRNFAISIGIIHNGIAEISLIYNVMDDILYTALKGEGAYKNDTKLSNLKDNVQLSTSIFALNSIWACENKKVNEKKIQQLIIDSRGARGYGSAALELAYVAEGIIDGYITMNLAPWDFAAGYLLIEEVGGKVIQATGEKVNFLENNSIIACNRMVAEEILNKYIELK